MSAMMRPERTRLSRLIFLGPSLALLLLTGCDHAHGFYFNSCHPEMGLTAYPPQVEPPCRVVYVVGDDARGVTQP